MRLFRRKNKSQPRQRSGSTNSHPTTFSYYARGASPKEKIDSIRSGSNIDNKPKTSSLRFSHLPSYIALLIIIIAFGYSFLLQPNPTITVINTPGSVHRDTQTYKDTVSSIWKKSIFNRTKFTISTSDIRGDIAESFPEIGDIQIELPLLGRRASVVLTPLKPALQLVSANGAYYVDATGKVMGKTSDLQENNVENLPFIRDESGISSDPGKVIIPGADVKYLQSLYAHLLAKNVAVESITLPAGSARQADVRVSGQPYYIKFTLDSDPRQAAGTYLAAKAKFDAEGTLPAEYIDVRVGEKVFYK